MELHGVTGAPYKHPQIRRKTKPTPFSRDRIDLDGGRRAKRSWKETAIPDIVEGDVVADFGLVEHIVEFIRVENTEAPWLIRFYNPHGGWNDFRGEQRVFAFSKDPDV